MADEEDIQPVMLPEEVMDFVERAGETIAENLGVDPSEVVFVGFIMRFKVDGRDITFEGMKVS